MNWLKLSAMALGMSGLIFSTPAGAESAPAVEMGDASLPRSLLPDTFRLWPGRAPGATSESVAETPLITVYRSQPGRANGSAVVIAPGGGYIGLAAQLEGASRGVG